MIKGQINIFTLSPPEQFAYPGGNGDVCVFWDRSMVKPCQGNVGGIYFSKDISV